MTDGSGFGLRQPYLYDTSEFFRAYPHHEMSRCIFWYYMVELAYYVSGLIWIFLEVKRKVHFFQVTILLLFHAAYLWTSLQS